MRIALAAAALFACSGAAAATFTSKALCANFEVSKRGPDVLVRCPIPGGGYRLWLRIVNVCDGVRAYRLPTKDDLYLICPAQPPIPQSPKA